MPLKASRLLLAAVLALGVPGQAAAKPPADSGAHARRRYSSHDRSRRPYAGVHRPRGNDYAAQRSGRADGAGLLYRLYARRRRSLETPGHVPLQRRSRKLDDVAAHGLVRPGARRHEGRRDHRSAAVPDRLESVLAARSHRSRLHRHAGQRLRPNHRCRERARIFGASTKTSPPSRSSSSATSPTSTVGTRRAFSSANRTARRARRCSRTISRTRVSALNGVVLLSSFLNSNIDYNDGAPIGGGDWAYLLYLPTEAAIAWYHGRAARRRRRSPRCLPEVENFALNEYLDALGQGAQLAPDRYNDVVAKLHRYTGLSEQYIRNSNLRIPYDRFENELLRERGSHGRAHRRALSNVRARSPGSLARLGCDRRGDRLGLRFDLELLSAPGAQVQHAAALPRRDLRSDLRRRRELGFQARRELADPQRHARPGAGDDLQPAAEDLLGRTDTTISRRRSSRRSTRSTISIWRRQYSATSRGGSIESGHMVYLHPAALAQFHADLERWYARVLSNA